MSWNFHIDGRYIQMTDLYTQMNNLNATIKLITLNGYIITFVFITQLHDIQMTIKY